MLKIYGHPGSRAARPLWVCRELGLQYEHVPTHFADGGTKSSEFLAINPAGRIPAIDDDGFRLAESMAINIYLAKKHGGELAPKSLEDEARMLQWSFWAMTEVEKSMLAVYMQRARAAAGQRGREILPRAQPEGSGSRASGDQGAGASAVGAERPAREPPVPARRELHARGPERRIGPVDGPGGKVRLRRVSRTCSSG